MFIKDKYETKLKTLDLEKEFRRDIRSGKGFVIKEKASAKNGVKNQNGIYSRKYGSMWGDDNPFVERYSCEQGCTQGKFREGEMCPKCDTEVKFVDIDLEVTGWIVLKEYKIITPIYYNFMKSLFGKKNLEKIIRFDKKIKVDGNFDEIKFDYTKSNPYAGIGLHLLYENFDEILEYFYDKSNNKRKHDLYKKIKADKDIAFTSHIPVYSFLLRPMVLEGNNTLYYSKVNNKYTTLVNLALKINKGNDLEMYRRIIKIYPDLASMQDTMMEIYRHVYGKLFGKSGNYRSKTLGARFNFTGRAVIRPATGKMKIDEVEISYLTFLELYKFEIMNLLTKLNNYSIKEAEIVFLESTRLFNEEVYKIMEFLLDRGEYIKINRNPSIHYNSLLIMRIASITKDIKNKSMGVPIQILRMIAGDFDGDVLNQGSIKDKEVLDAFKRVFNPRDNVVIDRNDGLFNGAFGLARDQMIALSYINRV